MKIAMLSFRLPKSGPQKPGLRRGGVERVAHDLAQGLAERGHDVTVWSADSAPPSARYRVRLLPLAGLVRSWLGFRLVSGYLGNILALLPAYGDAQAVIAHGDSLLLPLCGAPVLRIMHGSALDEARTARSFARKILQFGVYVQEWLTSHSQVTVAISRNTQRRYPAIARVIPNGVNTRQFFPGEKFAHPAILFVGTLGGRKRGHLLLKTFIDVIRPAFPEAQLWMVSEEGPAVEGVTYLSGLSPAVLAETFRHAWVFASPSCYEGFGLPYVEGMASGTAVLATDNPGSREVLDGGRYGRLCADDTRFGEALLELLRDPLLRAVYAHTGLQRARQFSSEGMIDSYEQILESMTARGMHVAVRAGS